jgi:hypothetical protein
MEEDNTDDLIQRLGNLFESIVPSTEMEDYPKEALPLGTWVRSKTHNKLGVVTDAFYGDLDKNGTKIIIYSLFLLPAKSFIPDYRESPEQFYMSNEYEYDIIAYLMINPVNIKKMMSYLGGKILV